MSPQISQGLFSSLEEFLRRLFFAAEGEALAAMADLDLSFSQVRVLFALAECREAVPINEVAGRLNLSVATAGRAVDQLVSDGLVDRRGDSKDRRIKRISLSDEGKSLAGRHIEMQRDVLREFAEGLPVTDAERLLNALNPILEGTSLRAHREETPA
ncbi:winged helix DNA-binding protein [Rhodococcus sp. D2-41]|uniref:MarR family winged helix-turn-helix transcriptional regulator n=1 Tax=Speluncibacter jeojiensis TaxID=2710754 RepID=UPI00240F2708|nr:MarR family transcriptional regulator [Rhodococcus sp. D2-41]MDG3009156.1 winged helix DNA-binding protein [Rhodococcus sp. D2-41]